MYKKRCCSTTGIPLRVCVAITIRTSQGMTVGEGEIFEKVVVHLPQGSGGLTPDLELVAFSRAKTWDCVAVGNNSNSLVRRNIKRIGTSEKNKLRRKFEDKLKRLAQQTQTETIDAIKELDNTNSNKKT